MVESIDNTLKMATCDLVRVSIAIYYQLYKLASQVSLVSALIEQDNFLYLSSFMDKSFSGNAFKFLIFFNLLTFNKFFFKLAGSLARSESHLLCCDWLFAADVTHSCARAPLSQDQSLSWQRKLMISIMVPTKPDWSGLVWSTRNLSYNSEFVHLPSWYRPLENQIKCQELILSLPIEGNTNPRILRKCFQRIQRTKYHA